MGIHSLFCETVSVSAGQTAVTIVVGMHGFMPTTTAELESVSQMSFMFWNLFTSRDAQVI